MANYGLWQQNDLSLNAPAADVDREALLDAAAETIATHNTEINNFLSIFADRTTERQVEVKTGNTNRNQPLDEFGRPQPVKPSGYYIVGFPLYGSGTAEGWNFVTSKQMTVKDYADSLGLMLTGDVTWIRDQIFGVSFYNGAGLSYVNKKPAETLTVYGPANGDTVTYSKMGNAAATDSHFAAQANAIDASHNPLDAMYADLIEHPQNAGRIVMFAASDQIAAIELLSGFAPVNLGGITIVPGSATATTDPVYANALNLPLSRTMILRGQYKQMWIVEWSSLPSGYSIGVAVDAVVKPLAMREYENPALQGFINTGEEMNRFPWFQTNYIRFAGFGARNRVGMYILYAGTSGSYSAPTSFGFPNP